MHSLDIDVEIFHVVTQRLAVSLPDEKIWRYPYQKYKEIQSMVILIISRSVVHVYSVDFLFREDSRAFKKLISRTKTRLKIERKRLETGKLYESAWFCFHLMIRTYDRWMESFMFVSVVISRATIAMRMIEKLSIRSLDPAKRESIILTKRIEIKVS